jgi:hypothetical protein
MMPLFFRVAPVAPNQLHQRPCIADRHKHVACKDMPRSKL